MENPSKIFEKLLAMVEERVFNYHAESLCEEIGLILSPIDDSHITFKDGSGSIMGELVFGFAGRLIKVVVKPSKEVYQIWAHLSKSLPDYQYMGITGIADSVSKNTRIMLKNNILTGRLISIYHRDLTPY